MQQNSAPYLSIVVPFYNEETNAPEMYKRLKGVLADLGKTYELVFVDDGSRDNTYHILRDLALKDPLVSVVQLARNYGQSAALSAGFDNAHGAVIVSMDGDLQHDPADLPLFIEKINEGYDIVSGWRKKRVDNPIMRRLPSFLANKLLAWVSGVDIHDFGTTYKAYRREFIKNVELFGDYHRYIPALAGDMGASIAEIPIKNVVRAKGKSKYGIRRFWPVLLDLIMLKFIVSYFAKPLRFFGSIGLASLLAGFGISLSMVFLFLIGLIGPLRGHSAMLLFSVFLMLMGIQFIVLGITAEINAKVYYKVSNRPVYRIKRVVNR
ncbi:MAG: glycosyltransferase family 2 protein [Candidatus Omnitrophica bacterium]|nr:glycosyltransferase family 2 protein [Candidatus Omnitrophota bacterium]